MSLNRLFHKDLELDVLLSKPLQCIWKNAPKETLGKWNIKINGFSRGHHKPVGRAKSDRACVKNID